MSEWKKVRLGSLCKIRRGSSPRPILNYINTTGGMPWVKISDATESDDRYIKSTNQYIIHEGVSKSVIVNDGDLILSNSGTAGLPKFMKITACIHDGWQMFSEFNGIDKLYLYYNLLFNRSTLLHGAYDSTMKNLTLDMLRDFEFALPPLAEQERIAAILGSLDDKIELNNRINKNLEEQASALFKRWFVDFEFSDTDGNPYKSAGGKFIDSPLDAIPYGWRIGTLSDLIVSTLGGDWGKENAEGNFTKDVYCIRGADIPEVSKGNMGKMPIRYILPKNHAAKKLSIGDIVVEISGGSPTQSTGRVALIGGDFLSRFDKDMVCTNFCRAVKPKEGYSTYIYYLWKYLYAQDVMFSYENGTTGIKNLNISGLLETEQVVIPDIGTASIFTEIVNKFNKMIYSNAKQIQSLAHMRDYLLPKLMNKKI